MFKNHPLHRNDGIYSEIIVQNADAYYGRSYQDMQTRVPNIEKARNELGWNPKIGLDEALKRTLDSFLEEVDRAGTCTQGRH
jgi:UDP-4-amino-4-deoxy-L-arabinose formyltransferase/UDP-glucuronic acid dehydrogenase (UDP-4-keto-hexauronic acid decarboxylating)